MEFNPGFEIVPTKKPMGFIYGRNVFGPEVENRSLDSIRASLRDPQCTGPDPVYAIAMDVGKKEHLETLVNMHLLYGAVTYAAGRLGDEPVRSQGHIHIKSPVSGLSTPEVYEIWNGKAIIYMQETTDQNPGRCFAVHAGPGDVIIVPPNWAHATISASPDQPLTFGAWCDRAFGFEYDGVRARNGLAWFPLLNTENQIVWVKNDKYRSSGLIEKGPEKYTRLDIIRGVSIYKQFEENPDKFLFVPHPKIAKDEWESFIP